MILLLYGSKGWIGKMFAEYLDTQKVFYIEGESRCDDPDAIKKEIQKTGATHVFCAIGRTSGPGFTTIDYLEQPGKLVENLRDNLVSKMIMASVCKELGVHLSCLGTGCIFTYSNDANPTEKIFTESDDANFFGSQYSTVQGQTDYLLKKLHPEVLYFRIRMPISNEQYEKKSFLNKLIGYQNIYSTLNSVTVLRDAYVAILDMIKHKKHGIVNLVDSDPITHRDILELYQNTIDPRHCVNYVDESMHNSTLVKAKRSKNVMSTKHLKEMLSPEVWDRCYAHRNTKDKIKEIFESWTPKL